MSYRLYQYCYCVLPIPCRRIAHLFLTQMPFIFEAHLTLTSSLCPFPQCPYLVFSFPQELLEHLCLYLEFDSEVHTALYCQLCQDSLAFWIFTKGKEFLVSCPIFITVVIFLLILVKLGSFLGRSSFYFWIQYPELDGNIFQAPKPPFLPSCLITIVKSQLYL